MRKYMRELLEDNPIIAAVKDDAGLEECCRNEHIRIIFLLYGTVCNIGSLLEKIKSNGKIGIVHLDLIAGLSAKEPAVQFLHGIADGIISTKPALILEAKRLDMLAILRIFLIDSMAYNNLAFENRLCRPDAIEVLPGKMPDVIHKIVSDFHVPVIAGGLISTKQDILDALGAGALSVSASSPEIWKLS